MKKERFLTLGLIIISLVLISFSGCDKEREIEIIIKAPTVELVSINDISETGAIITARITSNGGSKISEKGIVLDGSKNIVSTSINSETTFTITVSNLEAGRSYSVKAYAKNSQKTGYSSSLEFKTLKKEEEPEPDPEPILKIESATEVGHYSAILNAKIDDIVSPDDYAITFEYSQDESFAKSIKAEQVSKAQNTILLSAKIEDLSRTTNYKYRLKAEKNSGEILYSDTTEFSTSGDNFSVEGVYFHNVATDDKGNVYANGLFTDPYNTIGASIIKFDPKGNIVWRKDIVGKYGDYIGGIDVYKSVVYVQVRRDEGSPTSMFGDVSIDAYDATSGNLLWSTVVYRDGSGSFQLVVSEDGFIYSLDTKLTKLDLSGNIITRHIETGPYGFGAIAVSGDMVLAVGSRLFPGDLSMPMLWAMDKDLNIIWSQDGSEATEMSGSRGLAYFAKENLIFTSESHGIMHKPKKSYLLCYEKTESGATLKWKKLIDSSWSLGLKKDGDNFYLYSSAYNWSGYEFVGPTLFKLSGDIIWQASQPKKGNLAIFGNKLYMADDADSLVVITR